MFLIYNYYNVDPKWKCDLDANRVFLIEPSILIDYPIGEKAMNFTIELAKNISLGKTYHIYSDVRATTSHHFGGQL